MYDILYSGNTPPASFEGLGVIERGVGVGTLSERFADGRALNNNFSIIVRFSGQTTYFTPPRENEETPTQPPTIADLKARVDELMVLVAAL